jgi:hypothetical protein
MKFEYTGEDITKCVAYLDAKGLLRIRDAGRKDPAKGAVCLTANGHLKNGYRFEPASATRRFYPGDSITLTF